MPHTLVADLGTLSQPAQDEESPPQTPHESFRVPPTPAGATACGTAVQGSSGLGMPSQPLQLRFTKGDAWKWQTSALGIARGTGHISALGGHGTC